MKKIFSFILISFIVWSCHNNNSIEIAFKHVPAPKVAPCIEKAFFYFIEHECNLDTSIVYFMEFSRGYPSSKLEDTMIVFGQMHERIPLNGFKGLVTIDDYKLLVFDESDIGTKFYDLDSLKKIDLSSHSFSTKNIMLVRDYIISDGFLYLVGVQPSDFIPIKVEDITPLKK